MKSINNWTRDYFYSTNNYLLGHEENQTAYTYDQHGNMTKMPHLQQLTWDYADQLTKVVLNTGGDSAYYNYDYTGNRIRKVIEKSALKEERVYIGTNYELFTKTISGTLATQRTTTHIMDDRARIAQLDSDGTSSTIRYQLSNHLGSATTELDENALIISYEEYHPFGTTSYKSGRNTAEKYRQLDTRLFLQHQQLPAWPRKRTNRLIHPDIKFSILILSFYLNILYLCSKRKLKS